MSGRTLRVVDWAEHYESHESRKIETLTWVKTPNGHNSVGFCELLAHPDGLAHYGAWNLILQLASKCPVRGLLKNGRGISYTARQIAMVCRSPEPVLIAAIERLVEIGWLEWVTDDAGQTGLNPGQPGDKPDEAGEKRSSIERRGEEIVQREEHTHASASAPAPVPPVNPAAPLNLPPRLREAYREIGGSYGWEVATKCLEASTRIFKVPSEKQYIETFKCASNASVIEQPSTAWPDFRRLIQTELTRQRTGTTAEAESRPESIAAYQEMDRGR